jgi:hypothetical protein
MNATSSIVAAILAAARLSRVGGATSHEAYVEEYRKMLDVVRNQAVR